MLRTPPDILITTPESLFLLLTSQAREMLRSVETVIVDEVHAVAGTKRGAHLALSLERLERIADGPFQRIGLSATQRPLEEIGRFVSGGRPIELVDAGIRKELDLEVVVPLEDMRELDTRQRAVAAGAARRRGDGVGLRGDRPLDLAVHLPRGRSSSCAQHRSTIVFVNNRRLAERLALRLNELAGEELARAHHGSLAREQRVEIEELLKAGKIPCLVATSSLELGIDMGAVDLVVQVESPKSVARGLQRVGRAGHELDAVSKGRIFPKFRADLLESAVVAQAMREGEIEETRHPAQPARRARPADRRHLRRGGDRGRRPPRARARRVPVRRPAARAARERARHARRALPVRRVRRAPAAHRLGSHRGRDPRARRARGGSRSRTRARSPTAASTASSRSTVAAASASSTRRWCTRRARGRCSCSVPRRWRIEEITRDRVLVSPAPGVPGTVPFWKGEGVGRPYALGERIGRASREIVALTDESGARAARARVPPRRAGGAQPAHVPARAGGHGRGRRPVGPDGRRRALPRRDRRLARLRAHAVRRARARALVDGARGAAARRARARGAVALVGRRHRAPPARRRRATVRPPTCSSPPDEIEDLVVQEVGQTALFGARFRENAARALLIPRRRPGQRTPLWQQRLKAQSLLQVARRYGSFPVVLETYRECLQDVFDLPALRRILRGLETRELDLVEVETPSASPFAVVAALRLRGDVHVRGRHARRPSGGRRRCRSTATCCASCSARRSCATCSTRPRSRRSRRSSRRTPTSVDELHDLLRRRGDLRAGEYEPGARRSARWASGERFASAWAGEERLIAVEDAGLFRDALGVMPPGGLPDGLPRAGRTVRSALCCSAMHAATGRSRPARWRPATGSTTSSSSASSRISRRARRSCAASFVPAASSASGATPTCSAGCGARRSPPCGERSSRPSRRRSRASFPPGTASTAGRRCARRSSRCRGCRCPCRCGRPRCCRGACPAIAPDELDALCASGEVVWVGAGLDRVAVYFREDAAAARPSCRVRASRRRRTRCAARGARPFGRVLARSRRSVRARRRGARCRRSGSSSGRARSDNDAWTPLRASRRYGLARLRASPAPLLARTRLAGRRRRRAAGRSSPACSGARPSVARSRSSCSSGRASSRATASAPRASPAATARSTAELKALETLGVCRRGYFVEGLGGAQFALPEPSSGCASCARPVTSPRCSCSPPPTRRSRTAPLCPGRAARARAPPASPARSSSCSTARRSLFVERGGRSLVPLREPDRSWLGRRSRALVSHVRQRRRQAARGRAVRRRFRSRERAAAAARRGRLPRRAAPSRPAPVRDPRGVSPRARRRRSATRARSSRRG